MSGSEGYDFAIVGGGIVGASIAYSLAPHRRVVLLEGESAHGYHATGRSAALYAAGYGPPAIRALTRASRSFLDAPPQGFTNVPLLARRGAMFVGDATRRDALESLYRALAEEGCTVELLDAERARNLVPVLRPEATAAAVYDASAYDIDVESLLQGFVRGARARGATVLANARVQRLERVRPTQWRVWTSDGRQLDAACIVDAAGAWADEVARLAGVSPVGVDPRRRTAFLFDPPAAVDARGWPAVIDADERWYFKPDAGLLLGSPANADPVTAHDVVPDDIDVATGIHRLEEVTTIDIRRPRRAWAGLRTFVTDGEPVCGYATDAPGFFWAAALGGYGIQTSPAFGRLCSRLLLDETLDDELRAHGVRIEQVAPGRAALRAGASRTS